MEHGTIRLADILLSWIAQDDTDQVVVTVTDMFEGVAETYICNANDFNVALRCAVDPDGKCDDYKSAERAQGKIVRWIP